jgi:hypothetical protein
MQTRVLQLDSGHHVRIREYFQQMIDHRDANPDRRDISSVTADFVCFVCGAVFTTDEDRKVHLEKEAHGKLHDDITEEDKRTALEQERLNEERIHHI